MTAEIVIMNKSAVALAADSAVTISNAKTRSKIFNTANKVFSLSKYAPVGIMVFSGSSVMGVPWEIIIKKFREDLGTDRCDTIEDYSKRFFRYVDEFPFEPEAEKQHIGLTAHLIYRDILHQLDRWAEAEIGQKGGISELEIHDYLLSLVEGVLLYFSQQSDDNGILDKEALDKLHDTYQADLDQWIECDFERYDFSDEIKLQLRYAVIYAVNTGGPNHSGIVITGFGENEYFPHCGSFYVGGVVSKRTIRFGDNKFDISTQKSATILPFAQSNVVHTFISGISPDLSNHIKNGFQKVFGENGELPQKLFEEIIDKLNIPVDNHNDLQELLKRICQGSFEEALSKFYEKSRTDHSDPILQTTEFLNKDELARMAETLINLESFKKQVVLDDETVGGPIDVAVITKGDGFIWIKRKHYFRPELNHHFFRNYFQEYPYHEQE